MTSRTWSTTIGRFRSTALVAAILMSATACSGGGAEPSTSATSGTQSPSTVATPSATPTPTPSYKPADATGRAQNVPVPVLPEVAKTETKEGLEAFARYWFQLLSYGYETGDSSPIEAVTSPACEQCERAKEVLTGWHTKGRWLAGGMVDTPALSTTFRVAPDGNYQVAIQVSQQPLSYYNADGSLDSTDSKTDDSGNLMLAVFRNGSWYVNNIQPIVG